MSNCENCKKDVASVWKHLRPTETMTHRREEWLCADCHPRLPASRQETNV
jgi:hypothetical protein